MEDKQYQALNPDARLALFRQAFEEQSGRRSVGTRISQTFDRMSVAEEVINEELKRVRARLADGARQSDEIKKHPDFRRVWGAFKVLCPPDCMADKCDKVYRAHCAELVRRVAEQTDLRPGTDAECLCALLDHSLKEPLNSTACAAAEKLFNSVFAPVGEERAKQWARERWDGAAEQLISELRAKCGDQKRTLAEQEAGAE